MLKQDVVTEVFREVILYLFNDNLATGGILTGAILSCHVELSKHSKSKLQKKQIIRKTNTLLY